MFEQILLEVKVVSVSGSLKHRNNYQMMIQTSSNHLENYFLSYD
jgi:hypothetical protein